MSVRRLVTPALAAALAAAGTAAAAEPQRYTVIVGGKAVGHLNADVAGDRTTIDYDVKNNGRGPTTTETIRRDAAGLPVAWTIAGTTTFGSKVAERFDRRGTVARWTDATGSGSATDAANALYVRQSASPWALGLYARALLARPGMRMAALPGGALRLERGAALDVAGTPGRIRVTVYSLTGIDLAPGVILLDAQRRLFAVISPDTVVVRQGFEGAETRLRRLAATLSTQHHAAIERKVAHRFAGPLRIRNVRVFRPETQTLSAPVSVVVSGATISAIEPPGSPPTPGETAIDGAGGTLVAGMVEMHGHLSQDQALLNLAAGITTLRDMGNDNAVLDDLVERIDAGTIGGPRVVRSGFIEGSSPFSANHGILVDSAAAALAAVRWYAARGYWQIKLYNSLNPAWVPAIVAEAHRLGLRVAGHVPAFSTADAMIAAGYDEITHINQFMLQWVLAPGEDTRTLLRLTALKRLPGLDLSSARVRHSIDLLVERHVPIDPTIGIHERLTLGRDGRVPPGAVDYLDHMPIGYQRDAKQALSDTSAPGDDAAYRGAFDTIVATLKLMNERGVMILPGTDTGGSFTYHRELELYTRLGMTPGAIVRRATYDMARYLGRDQRSGSIEKGKLADFFLVPGDPTRDIRAIKTIAMVVKGGTVYFPAEIYPEFGIRPFAPVPAVSAGDGLRDRPDGSIGRASGPLGAVAPIARHPPSADQGRGFRREPAGRSRGAVETVPVPSPISPAQAGAGNR